jgi:hypothetical protein
MNVYDSRRFGNELPSVNRNRSKATARIEMRRILTRFAPYFLRCDVEIRCTGMEQRGGERFSEIGQQKLHGLLSGFTMGGTGRKDMSTATLC